MKLCKKITGGIARIAEVICMVMIALLVTAAVYGVYGEGFNPQDFVYFKY